MKAIFTVLTLIFISLNSYTQEKYVKKTFTRTTTEKVDLTKIYHKKTGEKIKKNEFKKLIKSKKKYILEKVIDENGNIEKYLYDPDNKAKLQKRDISKRVRSGESFPNFNFETVDGENINLKHLNGQIVILRFELFADNFRFKKEEIVDLDNQINQLEDNGEKISPIIIFISPKNEVLKGFDIKDSNFNLVSDGMNFHERYLITVYPSTVILDKEGKLINYFSFSDEIVLKDIISN